ncbi:MAG: CDP-glucose 4,6-dehydratase [Oligoflexia bacterium]|nr:CDP-glucose 4,6-dehydratase [Oligoflexia bacterium]
MSDTLKDKDNMAVLAAGYRGKRVLITGHTGFKGSWLSLWLTELGAEVIGVALPPATNPSHFELLGKSLSKIKSIYTNICDQGRLEQIIREYRPEIIFHLAAQAIVRYSYQNPRETWNTNVTGTMNLLEAVKTVEENTPGHIRAVIVVTSDKCYDNKEWVWGYRESDPLGGKDPYSSSKAAAELLVASYRHSFFKDSDCLVATVRAGNVIGGGDWAQDRLIPDLVRGASTGEGTLIRNPTYTRPWQHVLGPLCGYLLLGIRLLNQERSFADAWNFGPEVQDEVSTMDVAKLAKEYWSKCRCSTGIDIGNNVVNSGQLHEARSLKLDSSKASALLGWRGKWDYKEAVQRTIKWYQDYYQYEKINSLQDIQEYSDTIS